MHAGSPCTISAAASLIIDSSSITGGTLGRVLYVNSGALGKLTVRQTLSENPTYYWRADGDDTHCTGLTDAAYVSGAYPQNCSFITIHATINLLATFDINGKSPIIQAGHSVVQGYNFATTIPPMVGCGQGNGITILGVDTIGTTTSSTIGADNFLLSGTNCNINFGQLTLTDGGSGLINIVDYSNCYILNNMFFGQAHNAHIYLHDAQAKLLIVTVSYTIQGSPGFGGAFSNHIFINQGTAF